MNTKAISIIALLAAALIAASVLLTGQALTPAAPEPDVLVPGLEEKLSGVTTIEVTSGDDALEIRAADAGWTLPSKDGYPADPEAVGRLVSELIAMELIERKTASAANHDRLGLALKTTDTGADEGSDDAPSPATPPATTPTARIRLLGQAGATVADIVLGNRSNAGVFVRSADADQTWLADAAPSVTADAASWFDQRPVQVERDEVESVTVEHPDGEVVRIISVGDSFELAELPADSQPIGPWQAGQTAGALGFLTVEDVKSAASLGFDEAETVVASFVLKADSGFDDAEDPSEADDVSDGDLDEDTEPVPDPVEDTSESPTLIARIAEIDGTAWVTFQAGGPGAEDVNAITSGWAYAVSTFTRDALVKRVADLVEPIEAPDPSPSPSPDLSPAPGQVDTTSAGDPAGPMLPVGPQTAPQEEIPPALAPLPGEEPGEQPGSETSDGSGP
ncbi:MAG: DUF4340 domain-containing protein [Planctomycetota bacterium]